LSNVGLFPDRCPLCGIVALTISSLADKYAGKVIVCEVNVVQVPTIAEQYGVRAIPTVLIINNGKEIKRFVGLQPEAEYVALMGKSLGEAGD